VVAGERMGVGMAILRLQMAKPATKSKSTAAPAGTRVGEYKNSLMGEKTLRVLRTAKIGAEC